jgi:chondroitin sulfate proteoglycan 4
MIHKSPSFITPSNLSFSTNSDDDNLDIRFDIVRQPTHGAIQKLRSVDSSWISVESFTSNQLQLGQIRYLHTSPEFPQFDEFKFTATIGSVRSSIYDFRITFTKLRIGIQRHQNKIINGTKDSVIENEFLYHQTTPIPSFTRTIIYTLLTVPRFGILYVAGYDGSAKAGDSFTQFDVDERRIRYKTFRTSYSPFVDDLEFIVTVPECEDVIGSIKIIYNPDEHLAKTLTYQRKEKLYVNEGERAAISRTHFDVLLNKFSYLSFNLTHSPKYGDLCMVHDDFRQLIETFQLENLYLSDVYYCHDDSESNEDSMKILIMSDPHTDFQYVSEIAVDIYLQNDNPPRPQFNRKFPIVRGDSKLITSSDLKYVDPDIDSRNADIIYKSIQSTTGEVMIGGITTLSFNQDDLDNMRVYFNHSGDDFGSVNFVVTDGMFEVPGTLEIEASDPFLRIVEANASIVQEGRMVPITISDLSIETNLNVKPDQIEYKIIGDPSHGVLKYYRKKLNLTYAGKTNNTTSLRNFTQAEIEKERIAYMNTEVASMDRFKYRVTAKGVWTDGEVLIRIYPSAYWEPLQIKRNQTLYVEESTSVTISREVLEIGHPSISPGEKRL